MTQQQEEHMTPQQHAQHIASMLQGARQECRADLGRVNDPKAVALFESIAQMLDGAIKALTDYQNGRDPQWQWHPSQEPVARGKQPPSTTDMAVDISEKKPPLQVFHTEVPEQE